MSFQKHPELSKQTAFWGSFPCLHLGMEKAKGTTKNDSTRKILGRQDRHFVRVKKKNKTNKVEIISSHTATIANAGAFPKGIKDLKNEHKIFYSGKTRTYGMM